ADGRLYAFGL
nr:allatostatin 2 [Periplaneta americana]